LCTVSLRAVRLPVCVCVCVCVRGRREECTRVDERHGEFITTTTTTLTTIITTIITMMITTMTITMIMRESSKRIWGLMARRQCCARRVHGAERQLSVHYSGAMRLVPTSPMRLMGVVCVIGDCRTFSIRSRARMCAPPMSTTGVFGRRDSLCVLCSSALCRL
jgi:hypothetical protein